MRVYISIDMEGIAGISMLDQTIRGDFGYPTAQRLMTAEANAAAAGAFDAGATDVLLNDGHGAMNNLVHADLDPRIRLLTGAPKPLAMLEGLTESHAVAFFVGYHAAAGAPGVLAHTFSPHFTEVRLNGEAMSEADLNTLLAATLGVPVGLLSGDDVICDAIRGRFPTVTTVAVKTAHGFSAANSLSPVEACRAIRDAAARVLENVAQLTVVDCPPEFVVEVDMPHATGAERGTVIQGVERVADRTLRASFTDPRTALGFIVNSSHIAALTMRSRAGLFGR